MRLLNKLGRESRGGFEEIFNIISVKSLQTF